jgi:galactokinase
MKLINIKKKNEKNKCYCSGARLTGAGWGGCAVMLVPADKSQAFLKGLREQFYESKDDLENVAFITGPSEGAQVWNLQQ